LIFAPTDEKLPIGMKGKRTNTSGMSFQDERTFTIFDIPEPNGLVIATRGK
jgi:hypothetical protein